MRNVENRKSTNRTYQQQAGKTSLVLEAPSVTEIRPRLFWEASKLSNISY